MTKTMTRWLAAAGAAAVLVTGGTVAAVATSGGSSPASASTPPASSQPAAPPGSPADWWASVGQGDLSRVQADYFQAVRSTGAQAADATAALADDAQLAMNDVNSQYVTGGWAGTNALAFYQHYLYSVAQYHSIGVAMLNNLPVNGNQVQLAAEAAAQAKTEAGA